MRGYIGLMWLYDYLANDQQPRQGDDDVGLRS